MHTHDMPNILNYALEEMKSREWSECKPHVSIPLLRMHTLALGDFS